ncbi:hypothetical protein ABIA33_000430 [Streptacidiphilus sp. MAP12-16]
MSARFRIVLVSLVVATAALSGWTTLDIVWNGATAHHAVADIIWNSGPHL